MASQTSERRGLGRGLSALMSDVGLSQAPIEATRRSGGIVDVPVDQIVPNPQQPRRQFPAEQLEELSQSLKEKGVLQPLILRRSGEGYEIVAGERRWRAAQMAQLHVVPAILRDYSDAEVLEIAIIENIQREDLSPIEEAIAFRQLMEKFGHTQEKLATSLGKSRSHIANTLRLLALPDDVIGLVNTGALSAGHARALITVPNASVIARRAVDDKLSVREVERLVQSGKSNTRTGRGRASPDEKDPDTRALELDIKANLGLTVRIDHVPGQEAGKLTIHYKTMSDLDMLSRILVSPDRGI